MSLVCFVVSISLTSCTKRETPVEAGLRTKTLLVSTGAEPADLDPHVCFLFAEQLVQIALFEGLTAYDEKTALAVPAAAERWEASADGLTWTFHLRAGLLWSNGDPLTADDFVRSWRRGLTPAVANPSAYLFSIVKNADAFNAGKLTDPAAVGFAAPDARTVVITLTQPTPILPLYAALPCWAPINPRVLARFNATDKRGPEWTRPGNLVGNGPFTLTEWTPNARIVVAKNPRYWDAARTRLERVVFFPTDKSEVDERNFRAGQVHVTHSLPPTKITAYQGSAPDQLRIERFLNTRYVNFNCGKPPFDDRRVRQALTLAIDRAAISKAVYFGTYQPATGLVPNPCGDYVPRVHLATDLVAARRLLAEAGFPNGKGFPAFSIQTSQREELQRVGEVIQAQWKKELGVSVTLEPFELKTLMQNQTNKSYTAAISNWVADFADPVSYLNLFTSDSGNNSTAWSNPAFDRLLQQAAQTVDGATRLETLQQAEALLLAECPMAPLFFETANYLVHPSVKGWDPAPLRLRRYQRISLER